MADQNVTAADFPPGYLEEYQGNTLLILAITFVPVELFFVGLRFYARWLGRVEWGADDTLIIPGTIINIGLCACAISSVLDGGVGRHLEYLSLAGPETISNWLKYTIAIPMLYLPAVVFPKLAILAIYHRIFSKRSYRIACYIVAGIMIGNWIGAAVATFFMCIPFNSIWDKTIPGSRCFDIASYLRWTSLANIVTDIVMLVLPLPVIWKIQTTTNTKIGLTITFATGSLGLVTSIIRFAGFFGEAANTDSSWVAVRLLTWSIVEAGTYLIAACLPKYRPLAIVLWRKTPLSLARSRANSARPMTQSQTKRESHAVPPELQQNDGVTWFDDDGATLVRVCKDEDSSMVDADYGLQKHIGNHNILVRSEFDVESRSR